MRDQALIYARRGWPVFPCKPNDKTPLTPNGFKNATTDEDIVEELWRSHPNANIGIATGEASGIFVLDIDVKNGGGESLAKLRREYGEFQTYTVATGGGGLHFYFKHPGSEYRNRANILPGVDVRGDGGYVIAPPSLHASGKSYRIVTDIPPQPVPQWLKDLVKNVYKEPVKIVATDEDIVPEGGRNDYLWRLGGFYRRKGQSESILTATLLAYNEEKCNPPLPEEAVKDIARRLCLYNAGAPILYTEHAVDKNVLHISECFTPMVDYLKSDILRKGEPTGILGIDELLGGGKRLGELTIWHAETKTGKNALWHKMMHIWLSKGIPVGYASRELDPTSEVCPNLLTIELKLNVWDFFDAHKDTAPPQDILEKMERAMKRWPLYFARGNGWFLIEDISDWIDECIKSGVRHFWFDHLHYLLQNPEDYKEASLVIKQLKTIAREKNVHIDIIVQPTKLGMDGKLGLETVRGGSSIVQAADNFFILERNIPEDKTIMRVTLKVARHRKCELGERYLKYDPKLLDYIEVNKVDTPQAIPAPRPSPLYEKML